MNNTRVLSSVVYYTVLALGSYYLMAGTLQTLGVLDIPFVLPDLQGLENTPAEIPSLLVLALYYLPDPIHGNISIVNFVRLAEVILFVALFFVTQLFYVRLSSHLSGKPVPNKNKIGLAIISSFQTMILTIGIITAVLDIPFDETSMYVVYCRDGLTVFSVFVDLAIIASVWFAWGNVYYRLFRKDNFSIIINNLPHKLFLISLILVVATALAQILIMLQGRKIYFVQGSYTGLVFGVTVLLWSFGVRGKLKGSGKIKGKIKGSDTFF